MGESVAFIAQYNVNFLENCIYIHHYLIFRDAKNTKSTCKEILVAFGIIIFLFVVYWAINLDNKSGSMAVEIYNVPIYDLLSSKMKTFEFIRPEMAP